MSPAKILAVDDEADFELLIRQRFRRQIRAEEFTFRFAHHGEEALAVLAEEPDIELMLLDINMPVMDGLTLLAELRERQSDVRAIIVSAYGDMTNLRTAMSGGTVEKYIGDEIFAVFGLPDATPEDAANALRCADMMIAALADWNIERTQKDEQPLGIGIGLNYGPAVIGDVGSEHSLSFTVIG